MTRSDQPVLVMLDPGEMPLDVLARCFRKWFRRDPWGENRRCPVCSPDGDYGTVGRYAEDLQVCPKCGAELEDFWTNERVEAYFLRATYMRGFQLSGLKHKGRVVGWGWGYAAAEEPDLGRFKVGSNAVYIDTFGLLPDYGHFLGDLWQYGHEVIRGGGATEAVVRTHQEADYVIKRLKAMRYRYLGHSASDSERVFFTARLKSQI